jgi:hypothetical protein
MNIWRPVAAAEIIRGYAFPKEAEYYSLPLPDMQVDSTSTEDPLKPKSKSNLRLPPWPIFSRAVVPAQYKLANRQSKPAHNLIPSSNQLQGQSLLHC